MDAIRSTVLAYLRSRIADATNDGARLNRANGQIA
jgi:hypothetical protein